MDAWEKHGSKTGGFFSCHVNNEKSTQLKLRTLRAEQLAKGAGRSQTYMHLWSRATVVKNTTKTTACTTASTFSPSPNYPALQECIHKGETALHQFRAALRWLYVIHWNMASEESLHVNLFLTHLRAFEIMANHYQQLLNVPFETSRVTRKSSAALHSTAINECVARIVAYGQSTALAFASLESFARQLSVLKPPAVARRGEESSSGEVRQSTRAQTIDAMIEDMLVVVRGEGHQLTSIAQKESETKDSSVDHHNDDDDDDDVNENDENTLAEMSWTKWQNVYASTETQEQGEQEELKEEGTTAEGTSPNTRCCVLCHEVLNKELLHCTLCDTNNYSGIISNTIQNALTQARKFWSLNIQRPSVAQGKRKDWECTHCSQSNER